MNNLIKNIVIITAILTTCVLSQINLAQLSKKQNLRQYTVAAFSKSSLIRSYPSGSMKIKLLISGNSALISSFDGPQGEELNIILVEAGPEFPEIRYCNGDKQLLSNAERTVIRGVVNYFTKESYQLTPQSDSIKILNDGEEFILLADDMPFMNKASNIILPEEIGM